MFFRRVSSFSRIMILQGRAYHTQRFSDLKNLKHHNADVVVVGAGNAAMCAAVSAKQNGGDRFKVIVLERADPETNGGNSRFTAGGFRFAYEGLPDILEVVPDLTEEEIETSDFGSHTKEAFYETLSRLTEDRADPEMTTTLVENSFDTMKWMREYGKIRFNPMWRRQAFKVDGKYTFWGGLTIESWGGGPGLVDSHHRRAEELGIEVIHGARASSLLMDSQNGSVCGVTYADKYSGQSVAVNSRSVVLAAGGFESNAEWRTRYLGPGWDLANVRGTSNNNGDGIKMALDVGAMPYGNWSGCHSVAWDLNSPVYGDLKVGDGFQKHSYPLGIIVNKNGKRFLDEGADFRNYTYAKYGGEILKQPAQVAWQVFDSKVLDILRDEYRIREITRVQADTLEDLVDGMYGVDSEGFLNTVKEYNEAVDESAKFNPAIKDGKGTTGLEIPKSNWANKLDTPPYEAFGVTCGITFTFGGVRVDPYTSQVMSGQTEGIPGLYAAGEMVGGLFYFNYPGGCGLMAGSVFGKIAGEHAALHALEEPKVKQ